MRSLSPFVILLLCLLVPTLAFGAASYKQSMDDGRRFLKMERYEDAAAAFRAALAESPNDRDAMAGLGVALNHLGDPQAESYLMKALMKKATDPQVQFELGSFYMRMGIYAEARDFFENVIRMAPLSPYADMARAELGSAERRASNLWKLSASLGYQYDSNVILISDGGALPQGISSQSDSRVIATLGGTYGIVRSGRFIADAGYTFYQSVHGELSEFDVQAHNATLSALANISQNFQAMARYTLGYTFVDGESYSLAHTVMPSVTYIAPWGGVSMLAYRMTDTSFDDSGAYPTNSQRDSLAHELSLTQVLPLGQSTQTRFGLATEMSDAQVDYQDYESEKVFWGLSRTLPWSISADLYLEQIMRDYHGSHPLSGSARSDTTRTASVTLKKDITATYSVSANWLWQDNDSNIGLLSYRRTIGGAFVTVKF
jgi:tetratricopeptide (TPR) repeat protein